SACVARGLAGLMPGSFGRASSRPDGAPEHLTKSIKTHQAHQEQINRLFLTKITKGTKNGFSLSRIRIAPSGTRESVLGALRDLREIKAVNPFLVDLVCLGALGERFSDTRQGGRRPTITR